MEVVVAITLVAIIHFCHHLSLHYLMLMVIDINIKSNFLNFNFLIKVIVFDCRAFGWNLFQTVIVYNRYWSMRTVLDNKPIRMAKQRLILLFFCFCFKKPSF